MCAPIAKSKIQVQRYKRTAQKLSDMLPLSPCICQCMMQFFGQKTEVLALTSNLRAEQNLVHIDRFLHFSQKMVGVTLRPIFRLVGVKINGLKGIYRLTYSTNKLGKIPLAETIIFTHWELNNKQHNCTDDNCISRTRV